MFGTHITGKSRKSPAGRQYFLLAPVLLGLCSCAGIAQGPKTPEQKAGRQIAAEVIQAMGGSKALDKLEFLRFDFVVLENSREVVRRSHLWDRARDNYRIEGEQNGEPFVVLFNLKSRQGVAYTGYGPNFVEQTDPEWIEKAYAWHINDTFWLMSATKLLDRSANPVDGGRQPFAGLMLPTLELSFAGEAGQTPSDRYWFYLNPRTGRPHGWAFIPRGQDGPRTYFVWSDWNQVGGMAFPVEFKQVDGNRGIVIDHLFSPAGVSRNLFLKP